MLNGDVLTDLDLTAQLAQHERTGARVTLGLIGVEDPSRVRPGQARRAGLGDRVRREAEPGRDRLQSDQRRRVRHRARGARRAAAGRDQDLDRARGVPGARRQRALRPRVDRILARHRHARALPAGHRSTSSTARSRPRSAGGWQRSGGTLQEGDGGRHRRERPSAGGDRPRLPRRARARRSAAGRCSATASDRVGGPRRWTRSCSTAAGSAPARGSSDGDHRPRA